MQYNVQAEKNTFPIVINITAEFTNQKYIAPTVTTTMIKINIQTTTIATITPVESPSSESPGWVGARVGLGDIVETDVLVGTAKK